VPWLSGAHLVGRSMGIKLTIIEHEFRPVLESLGLRAYEDYASGRVGEIVGRSNTTETLRVPVRSDDASAVLYLKRYRYEGHAWRHRFRRDKAAIEARNYQILRQECGLPVPDVIAYGSRRRGLRLLDAFILTRGIPDSMPLDELVATRWPDPRAAVGNELRQQLLSETARFVSQMHAAGFFHVDLQWRNLLVADRGSAWPTVWAIDSARGGRRRWGVLAAHGRLRDLSSLAKQAMIRMTARERIRWLRCYFGVARLSAEHHAIVRTILRDRDAKDTHSTHDNHR
jgi:tRNA A-37 threonylcarbamoyl transferase component Bud32